MKQQENKVLFIFPSYRRDEITHYPYWYQLIEEVGKKVEAIVFFESGKGRPKLKNVRQAVAQKITLKPFNLLERFLLILKLVKKGYKKIYIHYSFWSVFLTKLISLFKPVKIYYWNCEKYTKKPNNLLLSLALSWCDVLVTGHESVAKAYRENFNLRNKPIKIVPNWIENNKLQATSFKLQAGRKNILFIHHLSPRKGSRELPEIISKTVKDNSKVHFHIIGDGPDADWLKQETETFKKNVTFYGSLPLKKVVAFYKAADIFIMPSRSEGFPRVILEAMAYGVPFAATKTGCVAEIAPEIQKQFLTPPGHPALFAKKVKKLIEFDNKKKLIRKNYQQAKKYSKAKAVLSLEKLFKK